MLVYRLPPWVECLSWLWGAGRGRGAQLKFFLAFLNQSSSPFLAAQPCCWIFFFPLGICTIWGAGFSMREPLFCTGGKLGFFREPYLVLPSLFSFLNLCKRLWRPPSSPGMPEGCHPALGHRVVEPPRRRRCSSSLAWPEVRVCVLGGGRGRWAELCLPFGAW